MAIVRSEALAIATVMVGAAISGLAAAEERPIKFVDLESNEVVEVRHSPLPGKAASLLPADGEWKLVWHDEFDGAEIDKTKWMCRESFWGRTSRRSPTTSRALR